MLNNQNKCILCGSNNEITGEHAIPKLLFSKEYKKRLGLQKRQLITVPTCKKCNASYSADEEMFREFLLNCSGESSCVTKDLLTTQKKAYTHAPGKAFNLLKKMGPYVYLKDGNCTHEKVAYYLDGADQEKIKRVLNKIIRCLLFFHTSNTVSPDHFCHIVIKDPLKTQSPEDYYKCSFCWATDFDEVCKYGYSLVPNTTNGIWILTFYNQVTFEAFLQSKEGCV